jgi:hypothetical protein
MSQYQRSCQQAQSRLTLFDKNFVEEEYRQGYLENTDFLQLKTIGTESIQIL